MCKFFKTMFGVFILVLFIGFFMIDMSLGMAGEAKASTRSSREHSRSPGSLKHMKVTGSVDKLRRVRRSNSDLNYMSKRRVPNGPDPIHNRKAGNSRRPRGRA